MNLIFIRHGESEANIHRIISNTGYTHGLTEQGINQAKLLSEKLKEKYSKPNKIISSPLKRADETAGIISNYFNMEHVIDNRLIEFHTGILEGKSDANSWNQLYELWNKWISGEGSSKSLPGGESLDDVVLRLEQFLNEIIKENDERDTIFCISHGGVLITALPNVSSVKNTEELKIYDLQNTDIVDIVYSKNEGLVCNRFGEI